MTHPVRLSARAAEALAVIHAILTPDFTRPFQYETLSVELWSGLVPAERSWDWITDQVLDHSRYEFADVLADFHQMLAKGVDLRPDIAASLTAETMLKHMTLAAAWRVLAARDADEFAQAPQS